MEMANVSQSGKLLEEWEDFLTSLKKTAERIRADSPHEQVTVAPKTSLEEKQNAGKDIQLEQAGGQQQTLYSRPTTADPKVIVSE